MTKSTGYELLWFCVSGAIAFLVDIALLLSLVRVVQLDPYSARLISFIAAASTTWLFNRSITFRQRPARHGIFREWLSYLGLMAIGGVVNIALYSVVLWWFGSAPTALLLGVVIGTGGGLMFNFVSSRALLFVGK